MTRLLTLAAGVCVAAMLNGCCLHHGGGYGGGYGGGGCNTGCGYGPQPYGAGFAPAAAAPGGCPDGNCGAQYGPVSMSPTPMGTAYAAPAYANGATVQAGVPATQYTATAPNYMPSAAPASYPMSAGVDPLPTF